mgnify:CR=1 FL=1|tara:strand:- start:270 stop:473 length:204 start_codon:yes stop_codon:yes gene_type:complete
MKNLSGKGLADTAILSLKCAIKNSGDAVNLEFAKVRLAEANDQYNKGFYWFSLKAAEKALSCLPTSI